MPQLMPGKDGWLLLYQAKQAAAPAAASDSTVKEKLEGIKIIKNVY